MAACCLAGPRGNARHIDAYRKYLTSHNKGPHLSIAVLEQYITAEQKLGRINKQIDPKMSAHLLMSSLFFPAFVEHFFDSPMQPRWSKFAKGLVVAVVGEP